MPSLKVDIHLPILLFKRHSFLYLGPDFRSLPLGVLSDIIEHRGERKQRLYPLTVYGELRGRRIPLLFTLALLYIDDRDERVTLLTHPIYLREKREGGLETLLEEVGRLSRFLRSSRIEVETHEMIEAAIAFPTSLSFLSYQLEETPPSGPTPRELESLGFREKARILGYEADLEGLLKEEGGREIEVETLDSRGFLEVRGRLLPQMDLHSYHLSDRDPALGPTSIPFFEGTTYTARKRGWLSSKPIGYLRWTPDLHEPMRDRGFTPLLFPKILENWRYRCGKVFDWGYRDERSLKALLRAAAHSMAREDIKSLQFSNVEEDDKRTRRMLESMGMRMIHRVSLMAMEVEG